MKTVLYIGLDVHKDSISIAIAHTGRAGEVRDYGKISGDLHALDTVISRLRKQYGKDAELHFCYEAGPCGFVIARRLVHLGLNCTVVAPSKLPRGAGTKIKTDRRDAEMRTSPALRRRCGYLRSRTHRRGDSGPLPCTHRRNNLDNTPVGNQGSPGPSLGVE